MAYVRRKILEAIMGEGGLNVVIPPSASETRRIRWDSVEIDGLTQQQVRNHMWHLRDKELVEYKEKPDGTITIQLTEAGRRKTLSYKLETLIIDTPKRWDRKWHIIVFDVPEKKKVARDALTRKMKELGLVAFQRSVWIYPYECKDEIDFVAEVFQVGPYIHYLVVEKMTNDVKLRALFDLS